MSRVRSQLILIAGPSGSGKSRLARGLVESLKDCALLDLDAYYHPLDQLSIEQRASVNFDHPDALDWDLLISHLADLQNGQPVVSPEYLFDRHTRSTKTQLVNPKEFLILEGIHSLHRPEIRDQAELRIFVVTNEALCFERRLKRDQSERGRTRESVTAQYAATVLPMAREFLDPVRQHADLIVSGEEPLQRSIAQVLARLGRLPSA